MPSTDTPFTLTEVLHPTQDSDGTYNTDSPERLEATVRELDRVRSELKSILDQARDSDGDGHIYYGPDCILCGHYGPHDEPRTCPATYRLRRECKSIILKEVAELVRLPGYTRADHPIKRSAPDSFEVIDRNQVVDIAMRIKNALDKYLDR